MKSVRLYTAWLLLSWSGYAFAASGDILSRLSCRSSASIVVRDDGDKGDTFNLESDVEGKLLFQYNDGRFFYMFPLTDSCDEVLVVWSGGSGYHVDVFSVSDSGAEHQLEAGSRELPILYHLDDFTPVLLLANASGTGSIHDLTNVYAEEGGKWIHKITLSRGEELAYLTHLNRLHNTASAAKMNRVKSGLTVHP